MTKSIKKAGFAVTAAFVAAVFGTHAMAEDAPSWCGPNKASVALLDGFGGNSWRQVTTASAREEAMKCASVTSVEYADGQGNTQKAISDIKGMAAKGVNALVVFGDAGPAVLPAVTEVFKAGTIVVPYRVDIGGKEGENYNKWIGASFVNDGENWGKWIKEILPKGGKVLFLSGPAGNSQGLDELKGLKSVLGAEYVFVNSDPFEVTNWDPALTQQVLTAAISKNPDIDVIVSDFGPSLVGALPAFEKFNVSIPALATSDGNSLGCFWTDNQAKNDKFKLFTVATGNDNARLAMRWAVALATGGKTPDEQIFQAPMFENSVSGDPSKVQCRADLPGSIYLSAEMSAEDQTKAINQ